MDAKQRCLEAIAMQPTLSHKGHCSQERLWEGKRILHLWDSVELAANNILYEAGKKVMPIKELGGTTHKGLRVEEDII